MPLRRLVTAALAAVLCVATIVPSVAAAGPPVKVAVIVGPVGEATGRFLARAEAAAKEAERWTSDVVRVYTPNATWTAARRAMQGASIVIYLGHGNGWPSPYRTSLYRRTQNGLGLNPVAGVDDVAHQYFGESYIARDVRLARGAIVLLHHLCYASGTSEPGLPEGSLDTARQRVDNYAAGFIRAGAAAVVAETGMGPKDYVRTLLGRHRSIERAWSGAPTANGHVVSFASVRTPGFVAHLDPRTRNGGYERSLVIKDDISYAALLAGAQGRVGGGSEGLDPGPSLAARGVRAAAPAIDAAPVAGTERMLSLALQVPPGVALEDGLQLGIRWAPLDTVASESALPEGVASTDGPAPSAAPEPSPSAAPATGPAPSAGPSLAPAPEVEPPDVELVQAEMPGELVNVRPTAIEAGTLRASVTLPTVPGLYRLSTTIHDHDGIALDHATQALVPALVVRVSGSLSVAYAATDELIVVTDRTVALPVRVANTGTVAWSEALPPGDPLDPRTSAPMPWLVGRWVSLEALGSDVPVPATAPAPVAPGTDQVIRLPLTSPTEPGTYLLLLDLLTPGAGSMAALGNDPGLVRVVVVAPEPPTGAAPS